jgi:hypothetical protein
VSVRVYSGYLHFWCEPAACDPRAHGVRGIGLDAFHGHVAALSVAGGTNQRAGAKVVRIKVQDGHFVVVPV